MNEFDLQMEGTILSLADGKNDGTVSSAERKTTAQRLDVLLYGIHANASSRCLGDGL